MSMGFPRTTEYLKESANKSDGGSKTIQYLCRLKKTENLVRLCTFVVSCYAAPWIVYSEIRSFISGQKYIELNQLHKRKLWMIQDDEDGVFIMFLIFACIMCPLNIFRIGVGLFRGSSDHRHKWSFIRLFCASVLFFLCCLKNTYKTYTILWRASWMPLMACVLLVAYILYHPRKMEILKDTALALSITSIVIHFILSKHKESYYFCLGFALFCWSRLKAIVRPFKWTGPRLVEKGTAWETLDEEVDNTEQGESSFKYRYGAYMHDSESSTKRQGKALEESNNTDQLTQKKDPLEVHCVFDPNFVVENAKQFFGSQSALTCGKFLLTVLGYGVTMVLLYYSYKDDVAAYSLRSISDQAYIFYFLLDMPTLILQVVHILWKGTSVSHDPWRFLMSVHGALFLFEYHLYDKYDGIRGILMISSVMCIINVIGLFVHLIYYSDQLSMVCDLYTSLFAYSLTSVTILQSGTHCMFAYVGSSLIYFSFVRAALMFAWYCIKESVKLHKSVSQNGWMKTTGTFLNRTNCFPPVEEWLEYVDVFEILTRRGEFNIEELDSKLKDLVDFSEICSHPRTEFLKLLYQKFEEHKNHTNLKQLMFELIRMTDETRLLEKERICLEYFDKLEAELEVVGNAVEDDLDVWSHCTVHKKLCRPAEDLVEESLSTTDNIKEREDESESSDRPSEDNSVPSVINVTDQDRPWEASEITCISKDTESSSSNIDRNQNEQDHGRTNELDLQELLLKPGDRLDGRIDTKLEVSDKTSENNQNSTVSDTNSGSVYNLMSCMTDSWVDVGMDDTGDSKTVCSEKVDMDGDFVLVNNIGE